MNTIIGTVRAVHLDSGHRCATHLILENELAEGDGWKKIITDILHFKKDGARIKITIEEI